MPLKHWTTHHYHHYHHYHHCHHHYPIHRIEARIAAHRILHTQGPLPPLLSRRAVLPLLQTTGPPSKASVSPSFSSSFSSMSWMDTWSRPSANSKVPAPLYLSHVSVPYCQTCGRVMSSKKTSKPSKSQSQTPASSKPAASGSASAPKQAQEIKYCSDRCRSRKPGSKDRAIESTIAALLDGEEGSGIDSTGARERIVKGDHRMVVTCDEIEAVVFGSRFDPEKVYGRRKDRRSRALGKGGEKEWRSVDMESSTDDSGSDSEGKDSEDDQEFLRKVQQSAPTGSNSTAATSTTTTTPVAAGDIVPFHISHVRPSQLDSEINFNAGGGERSKAEKIDESPADQAKRLEGTKRAEEREMVRRAARRAIVFGIESKNPDPKLGSGSGQGSGGKTAKERNRKGRRGASATDEDEDDAESKTAVTFVRKAEALMNGVVVEPSFAKGNWSIRWRE